MITGHKKYIGNSKEEYILATNASETLAQKAWKGKGMRSGVTFHLIQILQALIEVKDRD